MCNLLKTTEVRWFFPGEVPDEVRFWFEGLGEVFAQPARTDDYMPGTGSGLGIKLREGRMEIKARRARLGTWDLAPGVSGKVESWVKWGFRYPATFSSWRPVHKERGILFFQVDESHGLRLSTPGILPQQGGGVELTRIRLADGSLWWTLGIEVFGLRRGQGEVLCKIYEGFFTTPPVPLINQESCSYPALLSRIEK